jgi:membrane protein implicated in regulation of membrane protease activity
LTQNGEINIRQGTEMAESTVWWVLAGVIVAVELLTGTFYLLMLSFGFIAAALVAHAGATLTVQLVVAAAFSSGSVIAWRRYRASTSGGASANTNPDGNLDIGETVQIDAWRPDGTSTVKYRGANWSVAALEEATPPEVGRYRIVEVVGSRLIVKRL